MNQTGSQPQAVVREPNGRWLVPPRSPGRPRGLSHAEALRALLEPRRDELIGRVLEVAFDPDPACRSAAVRALELALSRIAPPPKQDAERVVIPGFADARTLQEKAEAVITAAATGEVSVEAATKLLAILESYARTIASTDHERRLAALEAGGKLIVVAEVPEKGDGADLV